MNFFRVYNAVFINYSPLTYDEVNVEKTGIIIFAVIQIYYMLKLYFKVYEDALDKKMFEKLVYTDLMTKINNRAAFEKDINEIIPLEYTYLIEIDVNCLKYVNDNMGHLYKDKLIVEVSSILKRCCNLYSFYRIGGDEFIVILKDKKEQDVVDLIKKMKQMALKSTCEFDVLFVCRYSNCKESVEEALKKADKMMYEDKIIFKKQKNILEHKNNVY